MLGPKKRKDKTHLPIPPCSLPSQKDKSRATARFRKAGMDGGKHPFHMESLSKSRM
jgi:hypothetical protein